MLSDPVHWKNRVIRSPNGVIVGCVTAEIRDSITVEFADMPLAAREAAESMLSNMNRPAGPPPPLFTAEPHPAKSLESIADVEARLEEIRKLAERLGEALGVLRALAAEQSERLKALRLAADEQLPRVLVRVRSCDNVSLRWLVLLRRTATQLVCRVPGREGPEWRFRWDAQAKGWGYKGVEHSWIILADAEGNPEVPDDTVRPG